jgi:hypothetical protein
MSDKWRRLAAALMPGAAAELAERMKEFWIANNFEHVRVKLLDRAGEATVSGEHMIVPSPTIWQMLY